MKRKTAAYNRRKWRKAALERDPHCHYCRRRVFGDSPPGTPQQATVDHMTPKAHGGPDEPSNFVLACLECNRLKGDMAYETFIFIMRNKRDLTAPTLDEYRWSKYEQLIGAASKARPWMQGN